MKKPEIISQNRWKAYVGKERKTVNTFMVPRKLQRENALVDGTDCQIKLSCFPYGPNEIAIYTGMSSGLEVRIPPEYHAAIRKSEYIEIELIEFTQENPDSDLLQYDEEENEKFTEGKEKLRLHLKFERQRNSKLVKAAKEERLQAQGELRCDVCNFSFQEVYGEEFIEAHHKLPFSQLTEETVLTTSDLALLCSNCHRMVHRVDPPYSIEELKEKIKATRNP